MAVISIKNKIKSGSLLVGNAPFELGDFESIATVTVGSSGSANITFSSIPSTYTHLQLRGVVRGGNEVGISAAFNGTSGNGHTLYGSGSVRGDFQETGVIPVGVTPNSSNTSTIFSALVCDILDYANTNKYKTTRALYGNGKDTSGNEYIMFSGGLWESTSAISSIVLTLGGGASFVQNSTVALYGIKG
jgi:hypothetical protein